MTTFVMTRDSQSRPEPLQCVPLRILAACVSSPDEMEHLPGRARAVFVCLIATPDHAQDFEQFPSKGLLTPQKLDLHVEHFAETEPPCDRFGRGAVDPDVRIEFVSQVSPSTTTANPSSAALNNAMVACVLLQCFTVPPSLSRPPLVDLQDRRCSPVRVRNDVFVSLTAVLFPHKLRVIQQILGNTLHSGLTTDPSFRHLPARFLGLDLQVDLVKRQIVCKSHDSTILSATCLVQPWGVSLITSVRNLPFCRGCVQSF